MKHLQRLAELEELSKTAATEEKRVEAALELAFELRNNNAAEAVRLLESIRHSAEKADEEQEAPSQTRTEWYFARGVVASCSFEFDIALEALFQALERFRRLHAQEGEVRALRWIAITYRNIGMYVTGLEYAEQARMLAKELGLINLVGYATTIVGDCYMMNKEPEKAIIEHREALRVAREVQDGVLESQALWSLAREYEEMNRLDDAIATYRQSYELRREQGDAMGMGTSNYGMASVMEKQGKPCEALKEYHRLARLLRDSPVGSPQAEVFINLGIARVLKRSKKPERARKYLLETFEFAKKHGSAGTVLVNVYLEMANYLKQMGEFEQALEYYEYYHKLNQDLLQREAQQTSQYFRQAYEFDKARQQNEIYRLRNEELAEVNRQNERLLLNVLPEAIAKRMKSGETMIAEYFENVTVLFADIVDFTQLAAKHSPEELVSLLNRIFSAFDIFSEQYNLEKIKTIGDAYMIVGGVPHPNPHHAESVANMALEMLETIHLLSKSLPSPIDIRIGIHTGAVVAGVIGQKKFSYDLWGDTVNTASRMESHGEAGKIHVSETVQRALASTFSFEARGTMEIKGKGVMNTYFLTGLR